MDGDGEAVGAGRDERFDFGVRNALLYFKDLKQATLDLSPGSGANQAAVGRLLGSRRVSLSELFDHEPDVLRGATKRVRAISYRAQRNVDKSDEVTLAVAWGMATWENGRAATPAAPIVLREATVARRAGPGEDFYLAVEGSWSVNTTLLHLLEVDFGVDVELHALGDLVEELSDHGNPEALFERVAKTAANVPGFSIGPRVVIGTVPRAPIRAGRRIVPADIEAPRPVAEPQGDDAVTSHTIELFLTGMVNPGKLSEHSVEHRILERFGPDAVIAAIVAELRGDGWPEALVEHADSGLRVRPGRELLQRWFDASGQRPRPSHWDATHFALWGLAAAPTPGTPALDSVARWGERRHHPVLVAWQVVAERRAGRHRRPRFGRKLLAAPRVAVPRRLDDALWGLPVDLLIEWSAWVFRQWPGAPVEFVLPSGTAEQVSAWYERARPVAELAAKTWVPFSEVDEELGRAAHRWVKQLSGACDGGGAPLSEWFARTMAVATEAVALRVGDTTVVGGLRGRRSKKDRVAHAEHAI
jgi:hypothetical protein